MRKMEEEVDQIAQVETGRARVYGYCGLKMEKTLAQILPL